MSVYKLLPFILLASTLAISTSCQAQQEPADQNPPADDGASQAAAEDASKGHAPVSPPSAAAQQHVSPSRHGARPRPSNVDEILATLLKGNQRFVDGTAIHPHESADYRASLAHEQHPFATVLTCSDSRVTPVLVFDQGIGDLFVIRVAGNVIDDDVAGSIEYAVDHLGAPLLMILGHEDCGAVTAAYHSYIANDLEKREPHEIESLLMRIEPAVRTVDRSKTKSEQITMAVEANVRQAVQALLRLPDMQSAKEKGLVKIVGAVYSVRTGAVRILDR